MKSIYSMKFQIFLLFLFFFPTSFAKDSEHFRSFSDISTSDINISIFDKSIRDENNKLNTKIFFQADGKTPEQEQFFRTDETLRTAKRYHKDGRSLSTIYEYDEKGKIVYQNSLFNAFKLGMLRLIKNLALSKTL